MMNEALKNVDNIMKKCVLNDEKYNLHYYSGYTYKTLYDWDQYFEGIAQLHMGWGTDHIKNGVLIFLNNQKENGFIPRAISYGHSENEEFFEHIKPFLAQITLLCFNYDKNINWLTIDYYEKLKKYLDYWLNDCSKNNNGLSFWRSGAHTGMDTQHERAGHWKDDFCEGVDLNTYIYRECLALSKIAQILNKHSDFEKYIEKAQIIKNAILGLWNEDDKIFYDRNAKTGEIIKVKSISCFMPIWAEIASAEQVKDMIYKHLLNSNEFWRPFILPALSADEKGYSEVKLEDDVGCNWRANVWVPSNYCLMHGLNSYGYIEIAKFIAYKTKELIDKNGEREYYTSESGIGQGLSEFGGWSILGHFMQYECENNINLTKLSVIEGRKNI